MVQLFTASQQKEGIFYRVNGVVSVRPLLSDEEIFTLNGFMRFAEKLGYRIIPPSDNM